MALNIVAGSRLWIGAASVGYKDTVSSGDFSGVSWTEIKPVTSLPRHSPNQATVSQDVVGSARTQYRKGITSYDELAVAVLPDATDPGQIIAAAAATTCRPYPIKIEGSTDCETASVVTISQASPGVVTWANHGLAAGTVVTLTTSGTLPTGLSPSTTYYVAASPAPATNTFSLTAMPGGTAINTTGAGSGTHTATAQPIGETEMFFALVKQGAKTGGEASAVVTQAIPIQPISNAYVA